MSELNLDAFPAEKSYISPWKLQIVLLLAIGGPIILGVLASPIIGADLIQGILFLILLVASLVFLLWGISKLIVPRLRNLIKTGSPKNTPYMRIVPYARKFAQDNNFEWNEYADEIRTPDWAEDFGFTNPDGKDTFRQLYEIKGSVYGVNFSYSLIEVSNLTFPWHSINRQGAAYASDEHGRRLDYATILQINEAIKFGNKNGVYAFNADRGYVYCNGQVSDRTTLNTMFDFIKNRNGKS